MLERVCQRVSYPAGQATQLEAEDWPDDVVMVHAVSYEMKMCYKVCQDAC